MHWLVPHVIKSVIRLMSATIRWTFIGEHDFDSKDRYLYAFWHARLLMTVIGLGGRTGWPGYMLISDHRDGAFIADTMHLFGVSTIRGSTTRGGARALLKMVRKVRDEACHLGITPDGPRGPREQVQMGTILLAKRTGLPVRPVVWATKRQWRVTSSWDHFYIPKPFTRGVYLFADAVPVDPDENDSLALQRVQDAMDTAQNKVDTYFK